MIVADFAAYLRPIALYFFVCQYLFKFMALKNLCFVFAVRNRRGLSLKAKLQHGQRSKVLSKIFSHMTHFFLCRVKSFGCKRLLKEILSRCLTACSKHLPVHMRAVIFALPRSFFFRRKRLSSNRILQDCRGQRRRVLRPLSLLIPCRRQNTCQ